MLVGPFRQLLTMDAMPLRGALSDHQLEIITDVGILMQEGKIVATGAFGELAEKYPGEQCVRLQEDFVAFPGLVDVHTHCCWAGSRAGDYASRLAGKSYLDIAKEGGGILDTVRKTRAASFDSLVQYTVDKANDHLYRGVTTLEVKSGYGLSVADELKILEAIREASKRTDADLVATCLAAHVVPPEFKTATGHTDQPDADQYRYLDYLCSELLPEVKKRKLSSRIDIFVEQGAFSPDAALGYLMAASDMGFDVLLHGDQFSVGAAELANEVHALSIDHLEAATITEVITLANGNTIPVALPGASVGLGEPFAPARKLLDAGNSLAIASDWNPGSAPMGNLITLAAILGAAQKLSMAEVWAAITCRAAAALKLFDRGVLRAGMVADLIAFKTNDYREVLYRQGELRPSLLIKKGKLLPIYKNEEKE